MDPRSAKCLLTHWQYMRQYNLLPDQTVQPLPKGDSHQHILNFHDGEEQVVDGDLADPVDGLLHHELAVVDRQAKVGTKPNNWDERSNRLKGCNTATCTRRIKKNLHLCTVVFKKQFSTLYNIH